MTYTHAHRIELKIFFEIHHRAQSKCFIPIASLIPYYYKIRIKTYPKIDICLLSNNIMDYHVVSQGKTTIPNVDDGEEMGLTDVRHHT